MEKLCLLHFLNYKAHSVWLSGAQGVDDGDLLPVCVLRSFHGWGICWDGAGLELLWDPVWGHLVGCPHHSGVFRAEPSPDKCN